ncbi:MAG: DMT family transporter [Shimia sp.]
MERKDSLDAFGVISLTGFALILAFNQVVIAVGGDGFQPVFMAGLRSVGAAIVLAFWLWWWRINWRVPRAAWGACIALGVAFALEFIFLFTALDLTTVVRASVIFYAMPVWAALGAWALLGERVTPLKALGLAAAFGGMAIAIIDRPGGGEASLIGDLCAMGASIGWASILLLVRASAANELSAEVQLFWQVVLSAPLLLLAALAFGPLVRDLAPIHWAALAFQIFAIASFGFLFWYWLIKIYPATSVASFSFLSPVFAVALGALLLGEEVGPSLIVALGLVTVGLVLINRPVRR